MTERVNATLRIDLHLVGMNERNPARAERRRKRAGAAYAVANRASRAVPSAPDHETVRRKSQRVRSLLRQFARYVFRLVNGRQ